MYWAQFDAQCCSASTNGIVSPQPNDSLGISCSDVWQWNLIWSQLHQDTQHAGGLQPQSQLHCDLWGLRSCGGIQSFQLGYQCLSTGLWRKPVRGSGHLPVPGESCNVTQPGTNVDAHCALYIYIYQGSYGHGKPGKVMAFLNGYFQAWKSHGKNLNHKSFGKVMEIC